MIKIYTIEYNLSKILSVRLWRLRTQIHKMYKTLLLFFTFWCYVNIYLYIVLCTYKFPEQKENQTIVFLRDQKICAKHQGNCIMYKIALQNKGSMPYYFLCDFQSNNKNTFTKFHEAYQTILKKERNTENAPSSPSKRTKLKITQSKGQYSP